MTQPKTFIYTDTDDAIILYEAIENNDVNKILSLKIPKDEQDGHEAEVAVYNDNVDVLKAMVHIGIRPVQNDFELAIDMQNLEMIKYFLSLGFRPNQEDLAYNTSTMKNKEIEQLLKNSIK